MDVKPFERMRVGKKERDEQEINILLGPKDDFDLLDEFDADNEEEMGGSFSKTGSLTIDGSGRRGGEEDQQGKIDDLSAEVIRLQSQLKRAKEINDEMWKGVVKRSFDVGGEGQHRVEGNDVEME
jgi:pre-rRNA-processing protein IPI3